MKAKGRAPAFSRYEPMSGSLGTTLRPLISAEAVSTAARPLGSTGRIMTNRDNAGAVTPDEWADHALASPLPVAGRGRP
jgi:hypothetical protein